MTNDEVIQYYIDHSDKKYVSYQLALGLLILQLEAQVQSLEAGLPPISNLDGCTI